MPPPVVADHVPHRAPRGARGGASPLLGDAMGEGHGRDASELGDHDVRSSGNGYSVLLAVCSAICPASFWSRSANLYWAEHFGE